MASVFDESTSVPPQSPSCSGNGSNDAGNFECNICFELAQDPIVTLCGHLFCWPCLYKWLHIHSHCQECPVCKALVQEEKLIPLYGRGKVPTDPRSKSIPGLNIPNRPAGQRPETAPPPDPNHFPHHGFGFNSGFAPMATARFGNFTLSAAFGGLIPSLFNLQVHGFPDAAIYGSAAGFPYGFSNSFHGGHAHGFPQASSQGQQADSYLKTLLLMSRNLNYLVVIRGGVPQLGHQPWSASSQSNSAGITALAPVFQLGGPSKLMIEDQVFMDIRIFTGEWVSEHIRNRSKKKKRNINEIIHRGSTGSWGAQHTQWRKFEILKGIRNFPTILYCNCQCNGVHPYIHCMLALLLFREKM